jgi:hypothetical protein
VTVDSETLEQGSSLRLGHLLASECCAQAAPKASCVRGHKSVWRLGCPLIDRVSPVGREALAYTLSNAVN